MSASRTTLPNERYAVWLSEEKIGTFAGSDAGGHRAAVRSPGAASGYVSGEKLADSSGFIDTGDIVERRGDRFCFVRRKGGIINVDGLKVHPEETRR